MTVEDAVKLYASNNNMTVEEVRARIEGMAKRLAEDAEEDEILQFETAADVEHKIQELEDLYQVRAFASCD